MHKLLDKASDDNMSNDGVTPVTVEPLQLQHNRAAHETNSSINEEREIKSVEELKHETKFQKRNLSLKFEDVDMEVSSDADLTTISDELPVSEMALAKSDASIGSIVKNTSECLIIVLNKPNFHLLMENVNNFMTFSGTFFLTASGLFDFDLTFVAETILFIILALVVTFVFLNPISKQLDDRADFINFNLRKSTILLTFGYEKLSECVGLLTSEVTEMNRQIKLTKSYTNSNFEEEVLLVQKKNSLLLSKLKGDLSIKSAYLFSNVTGELITLTNSFFTKKFQS